MSKISPALQRALESAAKAAARMDAKEGHHRNGIWMAQFVSWAAQVREDHRACGRLQVERREGRIGVVCPVHGRIDAPEGPE